MDCDRIEELVVSNMAWARYFVDIAMQKLPPHVDRDSLESAAFMALVKSAKRFDPSRGNGFRAFAELGVKGAILDEIREGDFLSRSERQKHNAIEQTFGALTQKLGTTPCSEEMAETMGIGMDEYHKMIGITCAGPILSLYESFPGKDGEEMTLMDLLEDEKSPNAQKLLIKKELSETLAELMSQLSCKKEMSIKLYFFENLSEAEIGAVLGLTESRVSQMIESSLRYLRVGLRKLGY